MKAAKKVEAPSHDVQIRNIAVSLLVEEKNNPNHMAPKEYKALIAAISTVGFLQPILVKPHGEDGHLKIIDGHHRARAAKELGMSEVPCVIIDNTMDEEVVLRIAMNKLRGELDLTGVGRAFQELKEAGWDMEDLKITGFSSGEISDLLAAVSQDVDKALPAEMEVPNTEYDPDDVEEPGTKLFALTLQFDTRDDLKKVKKALRHAGGKAKDMSLGLLKLLGEEKTKEKPS